MAAASLLALLDDIASVLDDVAVLTRVAAQKTAGVLGDDLALNAQQVAGVRAERELPVVWAVAKGSMLNKAILVPSALVISAWAPWLITPLLMIGGAYLCLEGAEKLAHRWLHTPSEDEAERNALRQALVEGPADLAKFEKDKIRGAVRTDFVLSAEIVAITLGSVAAAGLTTQAIVLAAVSVVMTVGVYGVVAVIVKLDDAGLALSRRPGAVSQRLGSALMAAAPRLMRVLAVVGTAAMFLVGGGILVHGLVPLHHGVDGGVLPLLADALVGVVAGALTLGAVAGVKKLRPSRL
jgi:uncharacterized protein